MSDEYSKGLARHFLEVAGYAVEDIPTVNDGSSADLFATCPNDSKPAMIVEAKEKEPDKELIRLRDEKLRAGGLHELHAVMAEQSVLNRIMSDAIGQLRSTQNRYPDALKFVFVVCTGFNAETRFEQFKHRVAGIATVVDFSSEGPMQECAFFRDSDFFKYRKILDGVILAKVFGDAESFDTSFYVNCYSSQYPTMRDCKSLHEALGEGFVDIAERADRGEYWSLHDLDGDRSNEAEMLKAVREKYGLSEKVMTMEMKQSGVEVLVPKNND